MRNFEQKASDLRVFFIRHYFLRRFTLKMNELPL